MPGNGPPQLGADDVVRYANAEHFLDDYRENLALGRMFVRTKRSFGVQSTLHIAIEGPGVEWSVGAEVMVLLSRSGFLGLEFLQFDEQVKPTLELMVEEVRQGPAPRRVAAPPPPGPPAPSRRAPAPLPREEVTVIGALPDFAYSSVPPEPQVEGTRVEQNPLGPRAYDDPDTMGEIPARRTDPRAMPSVSPIPTIPPEPAVPAGRAVRARDDDGEVVSAVRRAPAFVMPRTRAEVEAERAAQARLEAERAALAERAAQARADALRAEQERVARAEQERAARAEQERLARAEQERLARAEQERAARAEQERAARAEQERLARAEQERAARVEQERAARVEQERAARVEQERAARVEQERLARIEQEHAAQAEQERLARAEQDRVAAERARADAERSGARPRVDLARVASPRYDSEVDDEDEDEESFESSDDSDGVPLDGARLVAPPSLPATSDLEAPPPSAPPPAPTPAIVAEGMEAFDTLPGLRATASGVVRLQDPTELLGLYLTQLRHGVLGLCGGPAGEVGREVTIKLASRRIVSLSGQICARVGAWVFVTVGDVSEVRELLRDQAEDWRGLLAELGATNAGAVIAPPLATPVAPAEPAPSPSIPPRPIAAAGPPTSAAPSIPAPPPIEPARPREPPPPRAPVFDEPGPPQPGRLDGDLLVFRGPKDLEHEVQSNLKNGGMIANSPPLPIRTHKSLRVMLGTHELGVKIEADVVYAAGGRVGFAVTSFAEAVASIDRQLKRGFEPPQHSPLPPPLGAHSPLPPSHSPVPYASIPPPSPSIAPAAGTASLPPGEPTPDLFGRIAKSMSPLDLLELPAQRLESDADLEEAPALVLFEHITKRRLRGVLQLKQGNDHVSVYLHDGSVAFVDARPWNEEHALGKLFAAQKKLTEPQIRDVVERSRRERRPFGKTLLAMGLINANALVITLREQARLKIEPTFAWPKGTFELQPWSEPPTRADLVLTSGQSVLVKHIRHVFEQLTSSEIEELLAPNLSRVVGLTHEVDPTSALFAFQPKELRFLQAWVDAKRNLSDVVTGSPVGRLASLRLVAFGLSMNLLRFTDGKRAGGARAAQPRRSTDGRGYTAMKRQLEEDLRLLRGQNFFDVLGVHWSAHHRSYAAAYTKAKARFDLTRGELRDAPPPVLAVAKEALAVIDNAYKKLNVEEERIKYRKQLFDQTEREYSADMLIKQGEVMVMRGDRIGAMEAFETAVELAPTSRNRGMLAQLREGRTLG
jgi:hypothetical protein